MSPGELLIYNNEREKEWSKNKWEENIANLLNYVGKPFQLFSFGQRHFLMIFYTERILQNLCYFGAHFKPYFHAEGEYLRHYGTFLGGGIGVE